MRRIENILRFVVSALVALSVFHASPILTQGQQAAPDQEFVPLHDFVSILAVQPNKSSEQNLSYRTSEGTVEKEPVQQECFATLHTPIEYPKSPSSGILFTLTTSSYL